MNVDDYNGGQVSIASLQDMPTSLLDDSRTHEPTGKWEFDQSVTDCFEDMLKRSIPQLDIMRNLVAALAAYNLEHDDWVIDLGCSRGDNMVEIMKHTQCKLNAVGLEVSQPMVQAARANLAKHKTHHHWEVQQCDVLDYHFEHYFPAASVVCSVLTLMFIPINHRQRLLSRVHKSLRHNGAFILVEKVIGNGADVDEMMVKQYHAMKQAAGYDPESIEAKRKSLEGVLVPMSYEYNIQALYQAGFKQVDCFWRYLNFAGIIALKNV